MNTSVILTPELVAACIEILRPGLETFIKQQSGRNVIYIVVLDPVHTASPKILWEGSVGEGSQELWKGSYKKNATAKAELSFRTGLPSHIVIRDQPHLFTDNDFKFGGSIKFNGITVGASGLSQEQDYMFAAALAALIQGKCMAEMVEVQKDATTPDKYYFPARPREVSL